MDNTKQLQTISLCTGYGGIERGLEIAGESIKPVAYVEIEAYVIANLVKEIERGELGSAPIHTDVKTFPSGAFHNKVDLLTGGYPCQPFSTAGNRKGKDDPRHLWPYVLDHVRACRPTRCFFENVEGHINNGLEEVIADMEAEGYRTTWGIFGANEVGYAHRRKRVFILCNAEHTRLYGSADGQRSYSASVGCEEGAVTSSQPTGASQLEDVCDLHGDKWGRLYERLTPDIIGKPEPHVPRTTYGSTFRLDRIRLLGNGVVPRQAAWAWTVLNDRLNS